MLIIAVAYSCLAGGQPPVLTGIAAIKHLSPAEASIPHPVYLCGVLTSTAQDVQTIQDATGGIFFGEPEGTPGDLADIPATLASIYRPGNPASAGQVSPSALITRKGVRYGAAHRAPSTPPDPALWPPADFEALVEAFRVTGFRPANAWYLNDIANIAYAHTAPDGGRLRQPVLFIKWRVGRHLRPQPRPPQRAHAPRLPGSFRDEPADRSLATARAQAGSRAGYSVLD